MIKADEVMLIDNNGEKDDKDSNRDDNYGSDDTAGDSDDEPM